ALAVDRGEVDRLGTAAHVGRDLFRWDAEDERSRLSVNVPAPLERLDERRIAREVRHEAQLDLRVVGNEEHPALARHEATPDRFAALSAHRDVLEVRLRAA